MRNKVKTLVCVIKSSISLPRNNLQHQNAKAKDVRFFRK